MAETVAYVNRARAFMPPGTPGPFVTRFDAGSVPVGYLVISTTNAQELYWSFAQQLVHQTSNGTPLEIGDLYASGTISGTEDSSFGSLLELTWRGHKPIHLGTGEERTFLEDGDELIMTGWAEGNGYRIGLGEIRTEVLPAIPY